MRSAACNNPPCPKCGSRTRKNGHQPGPDGNRYQNYQCTNVECRHQFKPDMPPARKKEPKVRCPLCGRAMEVYKVRASYTRYRCSGRQNKSSPCHHKLDLPNSLTQKPQNPVIFSAFHFYKMRYSQHTVAIALYFSAYLALPATTVAQILRDLFNVSPSPDIIEIWTKKAASSLYQELGQIKLPTSGRVHIDETFLFHNRRKSSGPPEIRSITLSSLSSFSWDIPAAYNFLRQLPAQGSSEGLIIISDGLPAYRTIIPLLFLNTRHLVYIGFAHLPNNNPIERQHGWLKAPLRAFWGLKSDAGLVAFAINRIFIHNFFEPQQALDGKTPAEHAGVEVFRLANP